MRRFAAGLTILVFMTLAGEVAAGSNGTADPVGLISSAVIQPFWSLGADFTLVELSSPVFFNNDPLHAVFFNNLCNRLVSVPLNLTINGIALIDSDVLGVAPGTGVNGLVVIARTLNGFDLVPIPQAPFAPPDFLFSGPLHSRGHWVSFASDFINVVDPIAVGSPETRITDPPLNQQTYSPLRSAASYANQQITGGHSGTLFLICPNSTILNTTLPIAAGFPTPPAVAGGAVNPIRVVIFNNEDVELDTLLTCSCLSAFPLGTTTAFAGTYLGAPAAQQDSLLALWYTELYSYDFTSIAAIPNPVPAFTGYRSEVDGQVYFGRLHNASVPAYQAVPPLIGPPVRR